GQARGTLQLGQPAFIAERTGLPVISDFRAADVAAGGQGAPLASTLDALWLAPAVGEAPDGTRRAALNLGGIANITIVGNYGDPVVAFDTGPANCLMDLEAVRQTAGAKSSDIDGLIALGGGLDARLLASLMREPYFALAPPKSTGRELFDAAYLASHMADLPPIADATIMMTLVHLTALTVANACRAAGVTEVIASGGGVRNPVLMAVLARFLGPIGLTTAEARGLPSAAKEAYLFALLGFLTWHGLPGTVPGATGSIVPRILGRLSPGHAPLRLPDPAPPPTRLRISRSPRVGSAS
ncbi:MAG: anhydro-N-acetylmuramic acid kinase, partial [Pseudomonadota bacterium]|nr:anhydro-N-acetylmuramic acid kinase [Pseudomonadota bacterium]